MTSSPSCYDNPFSQAGLLAGMSEFVFHLVATWVVARLAAPAMLADSGERQRSRRCSPAVAVPRCGGWAGA